MQTKIGICLLTIEAVVKIPKKHYYENMIWQPLKKSCDVIKTVEIQRLYAQKLKVSDLLSLDGKIKSKQV